MEWELFFRLANGLVLGIFTLIRAPYILLSIRQAANAKDKKTSVIYAIASALMVIAGFAYLLSPNSLSLLPHDFPFWIRFTGLFVGASGLILLLWTHIALDKNFVMYVTSPKNHQLIVTGPYQWVRHPMYTAFLLITLGFFLISGNLFFGGFLLVIFYLLIYRMNSEEAYLLKKFKPEYAAYMKRTKRLIPFLY
jgi:protein-S-isoprenylcysteine O-methyltransferase Ste14